MINAIFTALSEDVPNMLLTLLLISLLVIWLQSKLNKEFGSLRKEISDGNAALREDIAKMDKDLRKEIAEGNKELRKEITNGNAGLREDIAKMDRELRKEIAEGNKDLREEIGNVSTRLARIEGKLELPALVPETKPCAKAG